MAERSITNGSLVSVPVWASAARDSSPLRDSWLRIRSWDDAAKVTDLEVPGFEAYVPLLEAHLGAQKANRP